MIEKQIKLSELKDIHAGRPAAVLGGGPSLTTDLARLPFGCLLFACNYHAELFCSPDFMVFNDDPDTDPVLMLAVRKTKAIRVSRYGYSDVIFDVENVWKNVYTSCTATWLALWMGCDPVLMCGMDFYQGPVKYCHPMHRDDEAWYYPLDFHLRPWIEECRASVPHPERIRAMSGPLVNLFGAYA